MLLTYLYLCRRKTTIGTTTIAKSPVVQSKFNHAKSTTDKQHKANENINYLVVDSSQVYENCRQTTAIGCNHEYECMSNNHLFGKKNVYENIGQNY